jgi:uncharacterized spore protein YtfJ
MSKLEDVMAGAQDTFTVKRVYGEPYEKNGVTFIPAASVRGGGGGGESDGGDTTPSGTGGGFGMTARPVGAYRIINDDVAWIPAADTTKVIVLSEIIVIVALLVLRSILRARRTQT